MSDSFPASIIITCEDPNPPCLSGNKAVIQSLSIRVEEHSPTKHTRSPILIARESLNLNLEAVWNFGRGDLFRLERQFGHSSNSVSTRPHSEQIKKGD